jgi:cohesin loading factor subunit SCC2
LTFDLFRRIYTRALVQSKTLLMRNPNVSIDQIYNPVFRRGIFTVGLLMRYFDFSRPDVNGSNTMEKSRFTPSGVSFLLIPLPPTDRLSSDICNEVFDTLFFFLNSNIQPLQREILTALGYFCVTNCEYLTRQEIRDYYNYLLGRICDQNELKITVLKNILLYLMEEENKMTRNDKDCELEV